MEIVKKIITWILILCGIAFAGVVICCGIMIASPSTEIFGYSYLNTNSDKYTPYGFDDITTDTINITLESEDFDIILKQGSRNLITINNNVFGFTKEKGEDKYARVEKNISTENGTINIRVTEPSGLFLTRKTSIVIELSETTLFKDKNASVPRTINVETITRNGKVTFGEKDSVLKVNNLTCSCTGRGNVDLTNINIANNLAINNILGKVNVNCNIGGEATVQSTIGSYTFKNVEKLTVLPAETDISSPSITAEEVGELNYTAQSGNLKINKYLLRDSYIDTNEATIYIDTVVKKLTYLSDGNAKLTINKLGNFNTNKEYSSWDWESVEKDSSITGYFEANGTIEIGTNYIPVTLEMQSGKASIKKALNTISAITNKASLNVSFYNDGELSTSSSNTKLNELNEFINQKIIKKLSTATNYMLSVEATTGEIDVDNIACPINIISEKSAITLNFIKVRGQNNIQTSSKAVKVDAQIDNFLLNIKANKDSKAKLSVKFNAIQLNSYNEDLLTEGNLGRVTKISDETYKGYNIKVATADTSCSDVLNITNLTGNITVAGYII